MAAGKNTFDPKESATEWADSLERFANRNHTSTVGKIKGNIGGLIEYSPFKRWLRINKPELFNINEKDCQKVISAAKERDQVVGIESRIGLEQKSEVLCGYILKLVQTIRDIASSLGQPESRNQAKTEQKANVTKGRGIWIGVKRIPRWIYVLVGFLAALLTCIYLLWWLWTTFLG